jgi:chemotaxis signal transduction protein
VHDPALIPTSRERKLYQGVRCNALKIALPYGWAETIVESFELTAVPRAPAWLVGATNLNGRIVPVIDLSLLRITDDVSLARRSTAAQENRRLLVGALDRDGVKERIALIFNGLPQQLEEQVDDASAVAVPSLIEGFVEVVSGERYGKVNVERLFSELSTAIEKSQ